MPSAASPVPERCRRPPQAALPSLRALYLQNIDGTLANPVARQGGYRDAVLSRLPDLRTLDGER